MSIFEYDKELEERKLRKAEYEAGVADAKKQTALALASRNMSYAEISEILNITPKSVRKMIYRAIERMQQGKIELLFLLMFLR